ncbi:MAG: SAM-dependent methyltransferase [Desulfuromonas sp.]|nr:MAG: SAM-dependent methyltransferase [Desulfuromonas sp.]
MKMSETKDFNKVALNWDDKPRRVELAAAVAEGIRQAVPLSETMDALDFGCGTGLVTFNLLTALRQVLAVDSAEQMLEVTREKAAAAGLADRIETCLSDHQFPTHLSRRFDMIYSSMVLHHIATLEPMIQAMVDHLAPGGYLALADLDREDGHFHDDPTGVFHHGIDRQWLMATFQELGLIEVTARTVHTIVKQRQGEEQYYTVFLVTGKRS